MERHSALALTRLALENYCYFEKMEVTLPHEGFTIIFGSNESGKSTLYQGFLDFIFGAKKISGSKLKIHATLSLENNLFNFIRSAGKAELRNDLFQIVGEKPLTDLFSTIDEKFYTNLFCCNHHTLREGGKSLFETGGSLREALFSTTTGISSLKGLQKNLTESAEEIFMPHGKKRKLNVVFSGLRESLKEYNSKNCNDHRWDDYNKRAKELQRKLNKVEADRSILRLQQAQIITWFSALDSVKDYQDTLASLETFKEVPFFPERFPENYRELQKAIRLLTEQTNLKSKNAAELQEERTQILVNQLVLDQATAISDLSKKTIQIIEYEKKLPLLKKELDDGNTYLIETFKELNQHLTITVKSNSCKIPTPEQEDISKFFDDIKTVENELKQITNKLEDFKSELEEFEAEENTDALLLTSEKVDKLRTDLTLLHEYIQKNDATNEPIKNAQVTQKNIALKWCLLPTSCAPLPSMHEIEDLTSKLERANQLTNKYIDTSEQLKDNKKIVLKKIDRLKKHALIFNEEELIEAKKARKNLWECILNSWKNSLETEKNSSEAIQDSLWNSILHVDHIFDTMRTHAEKTAILVTYSNELDDVEEKQLLYKDYLRNATIEHQMLSTCWKELTQPFLNKPLDYKQGIRFFQDLQTYFISSEEISKKSCEVESLEIKTKALCNSIQQQLAALKVDISIHDLSPKEICVCLFAETTRLAESIGSQKESVKRKKHVALGIEKLERILTEKKQSLTKATVVLEKFLNNFNWNTEHNQIILQKLCKTAKSYNEKVKNNKKTVDEIEWREAEVKNYLEKLAVVAAKLIPTADLTYPHSVADQLMEIKTTHMKLHAQVEQVEKNHSKIQQELKLLASARQNYDFEVLPFCRTAATERFEDIEEKVVAFEERTALQNKIKTLTVTLKRSAGDVNLSAFIEATKNYNHQSHFDTLKELENRGKELDQEHSDLRQDKHKFNQELKELEAGNTLASLAQTIESYRSDASRLIPEYITRLFAARLLKRVAERLSAEQEMPLLKRASHYFSVITSGAFSKIGVQQSEDGEDALVGVRSSSAEDFVFPSFMSDGTCDQLYLSLRLAAIEQYFTQNRALPIFFDDAFITFDSQRTDSALKTLKELGNKTQVVYFTHDNMVKEKALGLNIPVINLS
jgi:uncharacterized protein YhaN